MCERTFVYPYKIPKVFQTIKMENQNSKIQWENLLSIHQKVFSLNKENIIQSASLIMKKFDHIYPLSFNIIISQIVYSFFVARKNSSIIYLSFINEIEKFEENKNFNSKIIDVFLHFLKRKDTQESYYLINDMIENNFIEPKIVESINYPLFAHYMSYQEIENIKHKHFTQEVIENYEVLSKNDWELHKKYIKEGHNPNEIAKIIRNDEIEKLQEISSQTNFNFNQKIEPSLYERCSFINQYNVSLIDYAAFFSSAKCFKYLLMNNAKVFNAGKFAVAGGNEEIIHLCEQHYSSFIDSCQVAIEFHQYDIFKYIYENKIIRLINLEELGEKCVLFHNYEILSYLLGEGMKIKDDIINKSAKIGNLYLVKHFLEENLPPESILIFSSLSENIELVNLLLKHKGIEINAKDKDGNTVHMYGSYNGHMEIVNLLLKQEGIEINAKDKNGNIAHMHSFCDNPMEIVDIHIKQEGIDINAKDDYGKTALIKASESGHTEIVKLLLEQEGIDINAKDNYGNTTLIKASSWNHIEIVKLLLEQEGIDINAKDMYGETALMKASYEGFTEVVKLLLEQEGIDINAKDEDGETALMKASDGSHTEIVKLLLDQNGLVFNKNNDGKTVLINASENDQTERV